MKLLSRFALSQIIEQILLHEATTETALKMSYDFIGALFNPSHPDFNFLIVKTFPERGWQVLCVVLSLHDQKCKHESNPDEGSGGKGRYISIFYSAIDFLQVANTM